MSGLPEPALPDGDDIDGHPFNEEDLIPSVRLTFLSPEHNLWWKYCCLGQVFRTSCRYYVACDWNWTVRGAFWGFGSCVRMRSNRKSSLLLVHGIGSRQIEDATSCTAFSEAVECSGRVLQRVIGSYKRTVSHWIFFLNLNYIWCTHLKPCGSCII